MEHFDIQNLTFSHAAAKGKLSLDGVSLRIRAGEFLVLCGRSGSGKTTLLRHLKTVLTPNGKRSGEILFCGTPLSQVSERDQAAKIGFVMQNPDDQIVTDKVWHELAFGLESLGCDQTAMRTRVAEMACYFGIQDWFHRDVANLSGGQKQLLNLASIMAMQPEVLILDEPTSQLDPIAASDFLNTVRKINTELGTTVIITEHRLEDIFPYADRAVVMDSGKIIADDAPANVGQLLFEQKNPMFAAMPTPVRVFYGAGCTGESPLTVRQGRNWLSREFPAAPKIKAEPASAPAEVEDPALSLKELWFRYEKDSQDVVRDLSLQINKGEFYALVGGNIVFALAMSILNLIKIRKVSGFRMDLLSTFGKPFTAAAIMGVITYGVFRLFDLLVGGRVIPVLVSLIVAVLVYAVVLLKIGTLSEDDILDLPMGGKILRAAKKFHLMPS